jgi:hypothetical protein
MTDFNSKTLWIVGMKQAADEARLLAHAKSAKATVVCIRTTNPRLPGAINRFRAEGIEVFGWRWPACKPTNASVHYYALDEADYVVEKLIPAGLNGYVVDPESDNDKAKNDWDDAKYAPLAAEFCKRIKQGAVNTAGFSFAVTSGCEQPKNNKHIPWHEFVSASDVLLPQAYWRHTNQHGVPEDIHGGTPVAAINRAFAAWSPIAAGKPMIPMAGEIDLVTPAEIAAHGAEMKARNLRALHFYADVGAVTAPVLTAIATL